MMVSKGDGDVMMYMVMGGGGDGGGDTDSYKNQCSLAPIDITTRDS